MSKPVSPLPGRLINGARILGELWRKPEERCNAGWSLDPCTCEPKKRFCLARNQWLTLAIEAERTLVDGPDGLAKSMIGEEWDQTKLPYKIKNEEIGEILIGTAPECVVSMVDMKRMMEAPEVLKSTLQVMKTFKGSHVESLIMPEKNQEPSAEEPEMFV